MNLLKTLAKIDPNKWYRPEDVVNMKLFLNTNGEATEFVLYRLIKADRLVVQNVSTTKRPRYIILGKSLVSEAKRRHGIK